MNPILWRYGWLILNDFINNGENEGLVFNYEEMERDNGIKKVQKEFRMLDDDNIVYYDGFFYMDEEIAGSEIEFAPLDDFGTPNAGCTKIQYWEDGKWETL